MYFPSIDTQGVYQGMVPGVPGDVPDSYCSPQGVRVSPLGAPPTDTPGTWLDNGAAWVAMTAEDAVKMQISALEARQTPRMIRGAALGKQEDIDLLHGIEQEIALLREEL